MGDGHLGRTTCLLWRKLGVDVLYVLTGTATPIQLESLSQIEEKVLADCCAMFKEDQDAIRRLTSTLAEHSFFCA